jgi:hypothetical protein
VTLDYGATDGEANSHTAALGGIERIKEPIDVLGLEPDACILHAQSHTLAPVSFGPDRQLPGAIVNGGHRLRRVQQEIQDDLLQLDTIPFNWRQVVDEIQM